MDGYFYSISCAAHLLTEVRVDFLLFWYISSLAICQAEFYRAVHISSGSINRKEKSKTLSPLTVKSSSRQIQRKKMINPKLTEDKEKVFNFPWSINLGQKSLRTAEVSISKIDANMLPFFINIYIFLYMSH